MAALFEPFVWMLGIVVNIYFTVVLAEVVLHWLVRFGIVDVKNVYVAKISELLAKATGPVYKKISEKVPAVSGFDSPRLSCCWFCCFRDVSSTGST